MIEIEADFNELARGGMIRVSRTAALGLKRGERVELVDADEDMRREAYFSETDGNFAYFELARPHVVRITSGFVGTVVNWQAADVMASPSTNYARVPISA